MNLIILGAPGSGKGTSATVLREKFNLAHISTGDLFRYNIKENTPLGIEAKSYIDKGALVPDDVTIRMVEDRLSNPDCEKGYILDGFPRTIPQAEALDKMNFGIDCVLSIEVPDEQIVNRMSGRRVCGCGASYHIEHKKPVKEGICDICGGELICRKDDAPETVKERLRIYHEQTEPLKGYYEKSGLLKIVDGQGDVDYITKVVFAALGL